MKNLYIILLTLSLPSCQNTIDKKTDASESELCAQADTESAEILKGKINISPKGILVFENIERRSQWQRKIHLIPCSEHLKDYVLSSYETYLSLKSFNESFWVSVEGKFQDTDTLESPQKFLFRSVALIDEQEAITDSSQAMRESAKKGLENR